MKIFSIKNILKSALLSSIFSQSLAKNYLQGVERAELFQKTDFNVAQFNFTIEEDLLKTLIESASIVYENEYQEVKVKGKLKIGISKDEVYEDGDTQYSIGGQSTRDFKKINFNIKMDKKQLGRKHLRLRSAMYDPSLLRIKLSTDILNRLGLKSISSNYADVFINNEYKGFYALIDAYKNSWLKENYKIKSDPAYQFYQCKLENCDLTDNNAKLCVSDNDSDQLVEIVGNDDIDNNDPNKIPDENIPLLEFMNTINERKSVAELRQFMDVDAFIKCWIFEWLVGSTDHMLVKGKNYYLLRFEGVWIPLIYDFDTNFGVDLEDQLTGRYGSSPEEVYFEDWYENRFIVDELTRGDNEKLFLKHLQSVLDDAFNPDLLIPHIDDLKKWIDSYVKKDRNNNSKTKRASDISKYDGYSYDDFKKNSEYTKVNDAEGIKKWIVNRYKFVCNNYNVKCSSKYIENKTTTTTTTTTTKTTTTTTKTTTTTTKTTTTTTKTTTTTTSITATETNTDRCGKEYGKCAKGYCCSKYGWCGKTDDYCSINKGCQEDFGQCKENGIISTTTTTKPNTTTTTKKSTTTTKKSTTTTKKSTTTTTKDKPTNISTNGKCGKDFGRCPDGYCCSKYGWCGTTSDYCSVSSNCQKEFGICKDSNTSTTKKTTTTTKSTTTTKKSTTTTKKSTTTTKKSTSSVIGKCGKDFGKCPDGHCCSQYGWCGKSSAYCSVSNGCQSEYGLCN